MVEAAGVEPASGKVHRKENYMLSPLEISAGSLERTRWNQPSPIGFQPCCSGQKLGANPAILTSTTSPRAGRLERLPN